MGMCTPIHIDTQKYTHRHEWGHTHHKTNKDVHTSMEDIHMFTQSYITDTVHKCIYVPMDTNADTNPDTACTG